MLTNREMVNSQKWDFFICLYTFNTCNYYILCHYRNTKYAYRVYGLLCFQRITRDVFYVRREKDLIKTAKVNAYIMHIFGKIELLSMHATLNYFKIHYSNAF